LDEQATILPAEQDAATDQHRLSTGAADHFCTARASLLGSVGRCRCCISLHLYVDGKDAKTAARGGSSLHAGSTGAAVWFAWALPVLFIVRVPRTAPSEGVGKLDFADAAFYGHLLFVTPAVEASR